MPTYLMVEKSLFFSTTEQVSRSVCQSVGRLIGRSVSRTVKILD